MSLDATGQAVLGCGMVAIIGLAVLSYYNGRACLRRREASITGRRPASPAGSEPGARDTGSSCWPRRTDHVEDAWTAAEDEDEEGYEVGYEMNLTEVSPVGIGDALALDGLDPAIKRNKWAKVDSDKTQAAKDRQQLSYARAAAEREALSAAAAISHGQGQAPGLPGTRRVGFEVSDGLLTTPNSSSNLNPAHPPNSQWFGMDGVKPPRLSDADPVPVTSEREQGFGFSASTLASGAGAMPIIRTRRRSSDVSISVAPGPGTPRRGTLQQTHPDGANDNGRRSTVNLSAIERAQEVRRRQINGHHASMAGPPPSAAAATGRDDTRVDAAQRKAALERERLSSAVAQEDDRRRARMQSAGATRAPILRSNCDAEAERRATSDHMHRIRAAASMKKFGAPPSYGAAPTFDGSSSPAASNRFSTPGDYATVTEFVLDEAASSIRPKSVRRGNPLYAPDENDENNNLPSPPPTPAASGPVVITLSPGRHLVPPIAAGDEFLPPPPPTPDATSDWGLPAPPLDPVAPRASLELFRISE